MVFVAKSHMPALPAATGTRIPCAALPLSAPCGSLLSLSVVAPATVFMVVPCGMFWDFGYQHPREGAAALRDSHDGFRDSQVRVRRRTRAALGRGDQLRHLGGKGWGSARVPPMQHYRPMRHASAEFDAPRTQAQMLNCMRARGVPATPKFGESVRALAVKSMSTLDERPWAALAHFRVTTQ